MDVRTLTAKNQVTIPADVRKVTEADREWARFVGSPLSELNNDANDRAWSYL